MEIVLCLIRLNKYANSNSIIYAKVSHGPVGFNIQGFSPTLQKSRTFNNNASTTNTNYQIRPDLTQLGIAMPRNKVLNNIDHIRKDL